jgi:hypothetical protein
MPIPKEVLAEIESLLRKPSDWFSVSEVRRRRPQLFATEFVRKGTEEIFSVPHQLYDVRRDLDKFASGLLERELRSYESKIAGVLTANSLIPLPEDDALLVAMLTKYIQGAAEEIRGEIHKLADSEDAFILTDSWSQSQTEQTARRMASELSITMRLAGEISRLELVDSGYEDPNDTGFAQTKIERFLSQFSTIPHFFDSGQLVLAPLELKNAIRLVLYVIFRNVDEHRLTGFQSKFVSSFLRYLTCPRDLSGAAVEHIAALFEPFLKKFCFTFDVRDEKNNPVWTHGLDGLMTSLHLTDAELKNTDVPYWKSRSVEDACFRVAYQLRHKGAHEAHDYPYFERERNAYYVFAALVLAAKALIASRDDVVRVIEQQTDADSLRDLFVKIEELVQTPYGLRIGQETPDVPTRLHKLQSFTRRAQAIWPTCSHPLVDGMESEYFAVKDELIEADRDADIESYLEDMRSMYEG